MKPKLIDELLKRADKWITQALGDPENYIPPWDLTNDKPVDIWITAASYLLIKLLELKAVSEGEQTTALYDSTAVGVLCRARHQGKPVELILRSQLGLNKEESLVIYLVPITSDGERDWEQPPAYA